MSKCRATPSTVYKQHCFCYSRSIACMYRYRRSRSKSTAGVMLVGCCFTPSHGQGRELIYCCAAKGLTAHRCARSTNRVVLILLQKMERPTHLDSDLSLWDSHHFPYHYSARTTAHTGRRCWCCFQFFDMDISKNRIHSEGLLIPLPRNVLSF